MNIVACPSCSKQLKYGPQQAGKQVRCPACQTVIVLPGPPSPSPQPNQPVQPSPSGSQQVPTGAQQMDPLLGQQFEALPSTNQQPFPHTPAAYPQRYSAGTQAKQVHQKKKGINPVVLWGSIGVGVLVVIVVLVVVLGGGRGSNVTANNSSSKSAPIEKTFSSDIPIPEFLEPDPNPPEDVVGVTLLLDEYDRFAAYRLQDKGKRGDVFKWFDQELAKRGWVYVTEQLETRIWRKENRRLAVYAPLSNDRHIVTIHEDPDFKWNEEQFQDAVVLKPDETKVKTLLLAVHSFHSVNKKFPFDKHVTGEDADSGFSWVVSILPFIDKRELYEKFDMNGDHKSLPNAALGKKLLEELALNSGQIKWVRPTNVPETFGSLYKMDGASNTVCLVQSKNIDSSPWTKPTSIKPAEVIAEFKALESGESMIVGLYDGSVHRITSNDDLDDIYAILEPNDGKIPKNLSR